MERYYFKLFVTGHSPLSERAIVNLRGICEDELAGDYELIIIDVQENPQEAEEYKILATPTLVRELPRPVRRIIGDLTDTEQVRMGLLAAI